MTSDAKPAAASDKEFVLSGTQSEWPRLFQVVQLVKANIEFDGFTSKYEINGYDLYKDLKLEAKFDAAPVKDANELIIGAKFDAAGKIAETVGIVGPPMSMPALEKLSLRIRDAEGKVIDELPLRDYLSAVPMRSDLRRSLAPMPNRKPS
jgi:hypothetical protein